MLRIGTKLGISNGVLVALCIVIGLVSYRQTLVVREKVEEVTKVREPVNTAVYAFQNNLMQSAFATLGYLTTGDSVLLATLYSNRGQLPQIQRRFDEAVGQRGDSGVVATLQRGFALVHDIAERQIGLRDLQNRTMRSLLQDLDAIDGLLADRIQASLSAQDPVAYSRLQSVLEMKANANAITKGLGTFLVTSEPQFEDRIREAEKNFERYYAVYQNFLISSDEKRWSAELRRLSTRSLAQAKSVIALDKQRRQRQSEFLAASRQLGTMLDDRILQRTEQSLSEAKTDLLRAGERANASIMIALVLSVAFGLGAGYVATRTITGPLRQLSSAMYAIARGDRAQTVNLATSDELQSLGNAFNLMTGQLLQANEELRGEIAERRRAEEALHVSEERFRTIFEDAPIGIGLTDSEERLVHTNPALQEMLGYSEEELRGCTLAELIDPDQLAAHRPFATQLRKATGGRYQREVPCARRDGSTAWISLNVSRMTTGNDQTPYSIVMMEDISRRRATEHEMRMLAHTITSMHESVVITDSNDTILSVNPAFCDTYGYGEEECIGLSTRTLGLWTDSAPPSGDPSNTLRADGWSGELLATRKGGEEFPVLVSTSVVRDDLGSPRALVNISRDIREQKRLQSKLEQAERERLTALRQFALSVQRAQEDERARISRELHDDLCQRLSGMKFRVEVLEDQISPEDKRARRRLRDFARELDKTIIEVRRISSNLRPSVLDDFGLVTALRMLCRDFEKTHSIRTLFQHDNTLSRRVDPSVEIALYRIAQEALANVARHAGATAVTLRLLDDDARLRLVVRDDGKGFDRDSAARARSSGHGFGLISMRERTELLGGTFEVDSEEGKGTTIASTLPRGGFSDDEKNQDTDRG